MECRATVSSLRGAGGGKEAREAGCDAEGLCVCSGLRCEQGTRSCSLQPGQSLAVLLTALGVRQQLPCIALQRLGGWHAASVLSGLC